MGLLDDAIREHLDLKRRHGSDPTEVARLEHEALGPVRREPEPDAAAGGEQARDEHSEPAAHRDEPLAEHDDAEPEHREPAEHDHPEPAAPDPRHSDVVNQPTTEFRVEDHHDEPAPSDRSLWAEDLDEEPTRPDEPSPAAAADEDVLEETPEFLQETPEHDRLWFEQRPPRDFDFDG